MKLFYQCQSLLILLFVSLITSAQTINNYQLLLKNGTFTPEKNVFSGGKSEINLRTAKGSKLFVVIQFEEIPTPAEREQLKNQGIELLDYIPNYAYTATITGKPVINTLARTKARSIIELTAEQKMHPSLSSGKFPAHAVKEEGTIDVWINYPRSFSFDEIKIGLKDENFKIHCGGPASIDGRCQKVSSHFLQLIISAASFLGIFKFCDSPNADWP